MNFRFAIAAVAALIAFSCQVNEKRSTKATVFVGATIIDGVSKNPITEGTLLVQNGRIALVGPKSEIKIPSDVEVIDVSGKFIMPGIINVHGHIGDTEGLESGRYSGANVLRDLKLHAHYGVTTVNSLGGDQKESIDIRNEQDTVQLSRSRLYVAGDVITGSTPEEARALVDKNAAWGVDFIKIRVDDNLGTTPKMTSEIYEAIVEQAKKHELPIAAHIFYLEDAKALLRLGVKFIAHSVRDQEVDEEFIQLMLDNNAFYSPTLMREVSTFVYESTPQFFEDPFFLAKADTAVLNQLKNPERQQRIKDSSSAQAYKQALNIAMTNLKILSDRGIRVAFGTDSGPVARFQGYFEHKELEMMVEAGLTPIQAIRSSSQDAAACIHQEKIGTLMKSNWADFLILEKNPLESILNTRSIESVWIGGTKIID